MTTLPSPSLDIIFCAGSLQIYHYLFVTYREEIRYLHYKASVEWSGGVGPSKNRRLKSKGKKNKQTKKPSPAMGSLQFPCLRTI